MARLGVALLALLVAAAAVACLPTPASAGELASMLLSRAAACDEFMGECGADEDEEMGTGAGESLRRSLERTPTTARYISYAALRADQIICNKRGASYYINCGSMQQANPYTRGCSAITHCARNMV